MYFCPVSSWPGRFEEQRHTLCCAWRLQTRPSCCGTKAHTVLYRTSANSSLLLWNKSTHRVVDDDWKLVLVVVEQKHTPCCTGRPQTRLCCCGTFCASCTPAQPATPLGRRSGCGPASSVRAANVAHRTLLMIVSWPRGRVAGSCKVNSGMVKNVRHRQVCRHQTAAMYVRSQTSALH